MDVYSPDCDLGELIIGRKFDYHQLSGMIAAFLNQDDKREKPVTAEEILNQSPTGELYPVMEAWIQVEFWIMHWKHSNTPMLPNTHQAIYDIIMTGEVADLTEVIPG